ncbi:hypothetical protein BUL40_02325 [Croceivirga radicis]|uniref:Uncharacterized protein n=1 Tax=Croceivirga radicis TaxID=1929488 RepID=A0A1V6LW47_9FLAO|nr:hypothetical protein [Croceivirga radicis]OQD44411.1 hypothetical protein BUL40_02325 [Croceivirga radicis]
MGYINGFLSCIARINDKTNHGYDFRLSKHKKEDSSTKKILDIIFNPICESYKLEKVESPKEYIVENIKQFWFFKFQEKEFSNISLTDSRNHFSLSDEEWKHEWIEEFVDLLLVTASSNQVYSLKVGKTKGFYVCSSSEIILENESEIYHLHLSVSD